MTVVAPFAFVEANIAAQSAAMLANAHIVLANGQSFGAELNQSDEPSFDMVMCGAESLVYLSKYDLADGEQITINGRAYQVAGSPRRMDEHFSRADVVML